MDLGITAPTTTDSINFSCKYEQLRAIGFVIKPP